MSILITIWLSFVLIMGLSDELDQYHYLLFSSFMLYFTYLYNQVLPINLSIKFTVTLLIIPSGILWYLAFVYNDFLSLNPLSYEAFVIMFFVYTYLLLYLFFVDFTV